MTRLLIACLLTALCLPTLAACRGRRLVSALPSDTPVSGPPAPRGVAPRGVAPRAVAPGARGRGRVSLSDHDLQPVDAFIHASNRQWILGDTVEVYASKEYFSQALTLNEKVGMVHRKDQQIGEDMLVTMTYVGYPFAASAQTNPRVLIGTGLTASARKTLTVRLMKTANPGVPVQLRVVARGKAVRGRKDTVTARGQTLQLGGAVRWNGRGWQWSTIGR